MPMRASMKCNECKHTWISKFRYAKEHNKYLKNAKCPNCGSKNVTVVEESF